MMVMMTANMPSLNAVNRSFCIIHSPSERRRAGGIDDSLEVGRRADVRSVIRYYHAMPDADLYPYIYVNADGTAREVHAGERTYLETEFQGGDGAMPYIKDTYDERNGWGDLNGYLKRAQLPAGIPIAEAPAEDPNRPMSREESVAWLRAKGVEVVENADGSYTMLPKPR